MRLTFVLAALTLSACAVTSDDAPALRFEYAVPYDALAECVYANTDQKSIGTKFEPLPTMKEVRISEHGGFGAGRIITFRPSSSGGAVVEVRARMNAAGHLAWFQPVIDSCVARLKT